MVAISGDSEGSCALGGSLALLRPLQQSIANWPSNRNNGQTLSPLQAAGKPPSPHLKEKANDQEVAGRCGGCECSSCGPGSCPGRASSEPQPERLHRLRHGG